MRGVSSVLWVHNSDFLWIQCILIHTCKRWSILDLCCSGTTFLLMFCFFTQYWHLAVCLISQNDTLRFEQSSNKLTQCSKGWPTCFPAMQILLFHRAKGWWNHMCWCPQKTGRRNGEKVGGSVCWLCFKLYKLAYCKLDLTSISLLQS